MYEIKKTGIFDKWLSKLKDIKAKISIGRKIERMGRVTLVTLPQWVAVCLS